MPGTLRSPPPASPYCPGDVVGILHPFRSGVTPSWLKDRQLPHSVRLPRRQRHPGIRDQLQEPDRRLLPRRLWRRARLVLTKPARPALGVAVHRRPHGARSTLVNGINTAGDLVGFYTHAAGNIDGMLATPCPRGPPRNTHQRKRPQMGGAAGHQACRPAPLRGPPSCCAGSPGQAQCHGWVRIPRRRAAAARASGAISRAVSAVSDAAHPGLRAHGIRPGAATECRAPRHNRTRPGAGQQCPAVPATSLRPVGENGRCHAEGSAIRRVRRDRGPQGGRGPRPVPGPGQVLVQVKAAGINPGEAKIREGLLHARGPPRSRPDRAATWPGSWPVGPG